LVLPREDSSGNVYVVSQSSKVDLPKMPALGYCEAWMWVSMNPGKKKPLSGAVMTGASRPNLETAAEGLLTVQSAAEMTPWPGVVEETRTAPVRIRRSEGVGVEMKRPK
jgi:hypothetical protein